MIRLDIPGLEPLALEHLVLDLNGTLALDGQVLPGAYGRLAALLPEVTIHLLTADTGGKAASIADRLGIALSRIEPGDEARQKHAFVELRSPMKSSTRSGHVVHSSERSDASEIIVR